MFPNVIGELKKKTSLKIQTMFWCTNFVYMTFAGPQLLDVYL